MGPDTLSTGIPATTMSSVFSLHGDTPNDRVSIWKIGPPEIAFRDTENIHNR